MNRCIIFDLDGTLINSVADLAFSVNQTRRRYRLPELPLEKIRSYIGEGPRKLLERSFADDSDFDYDRIFPEYQAIYQNHLADLTVLYPGVAEGLERLRAAGIPLALVTNKHNAAIQTILEKLQVYHYFSIIVGFNSGFPHKPAPDALLHILKEFHADAALSWMVGDHFTDLEAGRRAGVKRALAGWGFGTPREEIYDFKADSFTELVDHLI